MAIIQVTPELLRGKASEVRSLRSTHDDTMAKLRTLMYALKDEWKGAAQDALVNKFESMQNTFSSFSEMLEEYAKLMDNSATKMQEIDITLAQTNR